MAFMEKLSKVANKVGEVAGDTFDYGKAKGKILLEKARSAMPRVRWALMFTKQERTAAR